MKDKLRKQMQQRKKENGKGGNPHFCKSMLREEKLWGGLVVFSLVNWLVF